MATRSNLLWGRSLLLAASLIVVFAPRVRAQDVAAQTPADTTADTTATADSVYQTSIAGEFRPAKGFDVVRTKAASLNISFYGLFRYVNQLPGEQDFVDHLGGVRTVKTRNDLYWHRTMVWLTGFFHVPRFRYNITMWSLTTTQQALLFGNLQYTFAPALTVGVGMLPNLTIRSLQGSWPFWAGSDRQMAEDFFRGGFSSGAYVTGHPVPRLYYTVSVNTNLSQLGVTASNDTRDLAYSASLNWMPTTGEFGPRGGLGDLEYHQRLATRFGISAGHSREGRYANDSVPPNAAQIKLSDGVNPFDAGALAAGVTCRNSTTTSWRSTRDSSIAASRFRASTTCAGSRTSWPRAPCRSRRSPITGSRCRACTWWCRRSWAST